MVAQHTPGPWVHGTDFPPSSMQAVVRAPDGLTLAKVGTRYTPRTRSATLEANARLMAAAPDMLETLLGLEAHLQPLEAFYTEGTEGAEWLRSIRTAIAKAQGGA